MHIMTSFAMILGAAAVILVALLRVLRDLLTRGPHAPPLVQDDGLEWPRRYQGTASENPEVRSRSVVRSRPHVQGVG